MVLLKSTPVKLAETPKAWLCPSVSNTLKAYGFRNWWWRDLKISIHLITWLDIYLQQWLFVRWALPPSMNRIKNMMRKHDSRKDNWEQRGDGDQCHDVCYPGLGGQVVCLFDDLNVYFEDISTEHLPPSLLPGQQTSPNPIPPSSLAPNATKFSQISFKQDLLSNNGFPVYCQEKDGYYKHHMYELASSSLVTQDQGRSKSCGFLGWLDLVCLCQLSRGQHVPLCPLSDVHAYQCPLPVITLPIKERRFSI